MIKNKKMNKYLLLSVNVFITGSLVCANPIPMLQKNNPSDQVQVVSQKQTISDNKEVVVMNTEGVKKSSITPDTTKKEGNDPKNSGEKKQSAERENVVVRTAVVKDPDAEVKPVDNTTKKEEETAENAQPAVEKAVEEKDGIVKQDSSGAIQNQDIVLTQEVKAEAVAENAQPAAEEKNEIVKQDSSEAVQLQDVSVEETKEEDTEVIVTRTAAVKDIKEVDTKENVLQERKQISISNYTNKNIFQRGLAKARAIIFGEESTQTQMPWETWIDEKNEKMSAQSKMLIANYKEAIHNKDFTKARQLIADYLNCSKELKKQAEDLQVQAAVIEYVAQNMVGITNNVEKASGLLRTIKSTKYDAIRNADQYNASIMQDVVEMFELHEEAMNKCDTDDAIYSLKKFTQKVDLVSKKILDYKQKTSTTVSLVHTAAKQLKGVCSFLGINPGGDLHPKDIYGDQYNSNTDVVINGASTGSAVVEEN